VVAVPEQPQGHARAERADADRRVQISTNKLAKIVECTQTTVRKRLHALRRAGLLKIYMETPNIDLADPRWKPAGWDDDGKQCYMWTGPRLTELKGVNTYRLEGRANVYEIVEIKQ